MSETAGLNLPPYTYVPGKTPHPISDPAGHMYQAKDSYAGWPIERIWATGTSLFNHGYYWEAHEAWEHLWLHQGRTTPDAMLVKGFIKLAACGVKCLEKNARGARRHAARAAELLAGGHASRLISVATVEQAREIAIAAALFPPILAEVSEGAPVVLTGSTKASDTGRWFVGRKS